MTAAVTLPEHDGSGLALEDAGETLDRLVRPHHWENPQPQKVYDLVVIGGAPPAW